MEFTGQPMAPIERGPALLSDKGPGHVSRAFNDYLHLVAIRRILAASFHPQIHSEPVEPTNGKQERNHQTIKRDVN